MATTILLDNIYPYELPAMPNDEKEILFHDRKREDQYWRRPRAPIFAKMDIRTRNNYIEQERRRILEGVWMFIDGEPVWISPMHYDFLMYSNLPDFSEPPRYYDAQRLDFYFMDFVDKDPNCYGELTIKPRRYGYTGMNCTRLIHYATRDFNQNVGMVSTDMAKAKASIFRPMVDSLTSRPSYLRPQIYAPNNRVPQQEIRFRSMLLNPDDEEMSLVMESEQGLRSWISPRSTTAKTFDGHKWHFVVMDEIWKWAQTTSPANTWSITKETLQVGGRIVGKAALFASMGDDDGCEEAVSDGIKMWGESDYNQRNRFGQTVSGLYRKFIPADVAFEKFIDKFGKCDRRLAKEFILEARSHLEEGTTEYLYHVRKYPLTVEEALGSAQNAGMFNALRLSTRLSSIQVKPAHEKGYVRGTMVMDSVNEKVVFQPNPAGFWKIAEPLPRPETTNRGRRVKELWLPPKNPEGVFGNDPVRTADNVSGHLSHNAGYAMQKFDYFNSGTGGRLRAQLYGRDEDVDLFNEQLLLGCRWFGYPLMTERQITSTFDHFRKKGMKDWLLTSPFDGATGVFTDARTISAGIEKVQALIKKPTGDGPDWLDTVVFEELLIQIKNFERAKSTKYDAFMGFIITLFGLDQIEYKLPSPNEAELRKKMNNALYPKRA